MTAAIAILLSPTSGSIVQGATSTVTVNVTRTGGFAGAVTVAAEGLPTGVTSAGATIAAGASSASLSLVSAATAAAATSSITIRATGTGVAAATATYGLTVTATPVATPAIAITTAPNPLTVTQGATGTVTITLTRSGGFTGDVTVAASGLPSGVTAANATIAAGATSATMTVAAGAAATVGLANLTFTATGTGVTAATSSIGLTVNAATSAGAFTLAAAPSTATLAAGGTATINLTIARTGSFTGAVGLAVSGAPAGVTATLSSTSVTGTTATLTLAAGASVTAGTASLTITGTGTGVTNATATVGLTLTGGTPGGGNITWTFCNQSGLPLWLAFQDGTGAWTRVTGTATNTYSFSTPSGRGGVAYVLPMGTGFDLEVYYGTSAELTARGNSLCLGAAGTGRTVTAPIAGAASTDLITGGFGGAVGVNSSGSLRFSDILSGPQDLIASRSLFSLSGTAVTYNLDKIILRRGLNPANGAVLPTLDFNSAEALTPATGNLTIGNLLSDQSLVTGIYVAGNNAVAPYLIDASGGGATRTYKGVPASAQVAGDFHLLNVTALASIFAVPTTTRTAGVVFRTVGDKSVTLGPVMSAVTVSTITSTPYARLRTVIPVQDQYNQIFNADYQQTTGSTRKTSIQQTAAYAAGTTLTIDIPDFSAVAGFDNTWGLRAGTAVTWTMAVTGYSTAGVSIGTPYVEGAVYLSATRMGTITP